MPPINNNFTKRNRNYWLAQILGWLSIMVLLTVLVFSFNSDLKTEPELINAYIFNFSSSMIAGILSTHLFRFLTKRFNLFNFQFGKILSLFFGGALFCSIIYYCIDSLINKQIGSRLNLSVADKFRKKNKEEFQKKIINYNWPKEYYKDSLYTQKGTLQFDSLQKLKESYNWEQTTQGEYKKVPIPKFRKYFGTFFNIFIFIIPWLLIYFIWKYVERNRKDQIDKLKLETTVNELELKTIKGHINPHFIFNSLNSIRALVDENPPLARTAITQLSNILRSSLQVEKVDVVPLDKELAIVNDYLALEKIRFEDRLSIELDIADNTLRKNVPPMMLQTLVENALKHGISKLIVGGKVKISSCLQSDFHVVVVENDGTIIDLIPDDGGFGLKSTKDRLKILYGGKAQFDIKNENHKVIATIKLPI